VTDDFQRYLRAKRTVDDRALDRRLVTRLRDSLAERATDGETLSVLEIGAGIGTMITRFIEWDVFPATPVQYTAVDVQQANIDTLTEQLRDWASGRSVTVDSADEGVTVAGPEREVTVEPVAADAVEYIETRQTDHDLLVAAALLDIVDDTPLSTFLGALDTGGLYYLPLTFDGATRFRPRHPHDEVVESAYHEQIDTKSGGNSRAGDSVLAELQRLPGVGVDAAGSDWVVTPTDGGYPADEAYFLEFILETVERAVGEQLGESAETLRTWLRARHEQLETGQLIYSTHQLDILGQVDDPSVLTG
jgi:hypothetical protein